MALDAIVARFIEHNPVTVMARLALGRALDAQWIDELFEQHRERQYTRELLFSTTVDLMSIVAVGLRPSLHAAAKAATDLPVSMSALYDKVNGTEPGLVRALVAGIGDLWISDRNFCTRSILCGWHRQGSSFLVREHGRNPNPRELDKARKLGKTATGAVFEQLVSIDDDNGSPVQLRRIELRLNKPTEDGQMIIRLLTNLPAAEFSAVQLAQLYRRRWRIEMMFQRLESVLQSEIPALGHPRAALLAFGVAILAYNVLALISRAVTVQHQLDSTPIEISSYYVALTIKADYAGMMIAVEPLAWDIYERFSARKLAQTLLRIAAHAQPYRLRKHPRGPKARVKKGYVSRRAAQRHVATARVIKDGKII